MKKYKVSKDHYRNFAISEVDIISETEHFVVLSNGNREKKETEHLKYCSTIEEAKDAQLDYIEKTILQHTRESQYHQDKIKQLIELKNNLK